MKRRAALGLAAVVAAVAALASPVRADDTPRDSGELLLVTEGNRMRRIDVDTIGAPALVQDVFIESAGDEDSGGGGGGSFPVSGRDVNGQMCPSPDGSGHLVVGEDTRQQHPPAGWGVFDASGAQVGKLTATVYTDGPEPHGCAFGPDGTLFVSEVGHQGFGPPFNGQLVAFFPPYDAFPGGPGEYPDTDATSTNYCKLATDLGTTGAVTVDAGGNVYVAASASGTVERFSPPFPTGADAAHGCSGTDALGSPAALPTELHRATVIRRDLLNFFRGMLFFAGLAVAPNGNLYVSSVATCRIAEYTVQGRYVRSIAKSPQFLFPCWFGTPEDVTVGGDGTVYYADLDVTWGRFPNVFDAGPGPNGKVWRVRFDATGNPGLPELILDHLDYPDGVRVVGGDLQGG